MVVSRCLLNVYQVVTSVSNANVTPSCDKVPKAKQTPDHSDENTEFPLNSAPSQVTSGPKVIRGMSNCSKCGKQLPVDGSYLKCSAVNGCGYHFECLSVRQSSYQSWGSQRQKQWVCSVHRKKSDSEDVKLSEKKLALSKGDVSAEDTEESDYDEAEDNLEDLGGLVKFINKKFSDQAKLFKRELKSFRKDIDVQTTRIDKLEKENEELRTRNRDLETQVGRLWHVAENNDIELRSRNLIIRGIPSKKDERVEDVVEQLAEKVLEVPIDKEKDIEEVFRLPGGASRPILVKLSTRAKRDGILFQSRKKKPTLNQLWSSERNTPIYVSEQLTTRPAEVLQKCAQLKKEGRSIVEAYRTRKGLVQVKKKREEGWHVVRDMDELHSLLEPGTGT